MSKAIKVEQVYMGNGETLTIAALFLSRETKAQSVIVRDAKGKTRTELLADVERAVEAGEWVRIQEEVEW